MLRQIDVRVDEAGGFEAARQEARRIGLQENPESEIVSWSNRLNSSQSPCCLRCEFDGAPAWEVYGVNHGGRLKVVVNEGLYVFIVS